MGRVEWGEPGRGAGGEGDRGLGAGGKVVLAKGRSVCIPVTPGCLSCPLFRSAGAAARGEGGGGGAGAVDRAFILCASERSSYVRARVCAERLGG